MRNRLLVFLWVLCLIGLAINFGYIVRDLGFRREMSPVTIYPEYDIFHFGVLYPDQHFDPYRPKGYIWTVHHTFWRLTDSPLLACRLLNAAAYLVVTVLVLLAMRGVARLAMLLALASPRMLQAVIYAGTDGIAALCVFLAVIFWMNRWDLRRRFPIVITVLSAVLAFYAGWVRTQIGMVFLFWGLAGVVYATTSRRKPVERTDKAFLWLSGAVVGAAALSLVLFRTTCNWHNIVAAALSREESLLHINFMLTFQPGFPDSFLSFLLQPRGMEALLRNWNINFWQGIPLGLLTWPQELSFLLRLPPLMAGLAIGLVLFCLPTQRGLRIPATGGNRAIMVSLLAAHVLSYAFISLAFHRPRFFLYATPLLPFLLLHTLQDQRRDRSLLVGLFFLLSFVLSYGNFCTLYARMFAPFSSTSYLEARHYHVPWQSQVVLKNKQSGETVSYKGQNYYRSPLTDRYYLPKEAAKNPENWVMSYIDRNKEVFQWDFQAEDVYTYGQVSPPVLRSIDSLKASGNYCKQGSKRYRGVKILGAFESGLDGWAAEGAAFHNQPVKPKEEYYGYGGKQVLCSRAGKQHYAATGKVVSPVFVPRKGDTLGFCVGGGGEPKVGVYLCKGEEVLKVWRGRNSHYLFFRLQDLSSWAGHPLHIEIRDLGSDAWDYILADHFVLYREKQ